MPEETMSKEQQTELLFMQLVMMFQGMAMQQLGKVMNPMTQKIDRDLGQAKNFIDLLAMLEEKTEGNLGEGEQKLLQQALFDLRMNYVDEVKKGEAAEAVAAEAEPDAGSESESENEGEPESIGSEAKSEEGGEPESAESEPEDEGEPESIGSEAESEVGGEPESAESESEDTKGSSDEEPTV